ncbi:polysaccharide deacetylase family protein [Micromonospora sp. NPDC049679]|uniref:polysaccharide deacetylase family protein n=1 Tax=Micromonospora sp. NPDC049679 TaxID=3155920 RepID=UPI0033D7D456
MTLARRQMLTKAASALLGAGTAGGVKMAHDAITAYDPLPFYGGYASPIHGDRKTPPRSPAVDVIWSVDTANKLVALTFDDGPKPNWTPEVLSILEQTRTRATFFMVGANARDHGAIVAGRLGQHEVGNHTWRHQDLARLTFEEAYETLKRTHEHLTKLWGREPTLLRPPYGHLAGSTLLAANELGYRVVLWNRQMLESQYTSNPRGLVDYIVTSCAPGTILLAHDTGPADRLVAIRALPEVVRGLRAEGFEFVTVSELLAEQD